jgi:Helix-turn-helix domain
VVDGILRAAREQGSDVPEGLLFRAGQVFYHAGQVAEVRLTGLLPSVPDTAGLLPFTAWSTPTPPTVTAGPQGELILDVTDRGRSHFSALVVPARAAVSQMLVACLWDLREPTPAEQVVEASTLTPSTPLLGNQHLIVLNPAHYQAIRESLAHNTFTTVEGVPWPAAPIDTGPARGLLQLRPVTMEVQPWMSPEETDHWAQRMWEQRKELSDLDADALDALCGLWLTQVQRVGDDAVADVDELLALRGLQPKRGGAGRLGGYRPEQRDAMLRAVLHVQNLWVHLTALEVYQYTGVRPRRRQCQPTPETIQSRVFTITDLLGHLRPDGFMNVEKFIFRPGKVFAHFLFGAGRQTALLAAQALRYDPVQQTWEKRLARYLSYQWRCKAHAGDLLQPFKVASLLAAAGATCNRRKPFLTRARLEKALDTLLQDQVIAAWQYDRWDETCTTRRGWADVWLRATILIEPPDVIQTHYQAIARQIEPGRPALSIPVTLGDRLRQRRQQLGLTLLQVAEQLGISPSYLHRLEQGRRGKRPAAPLQQRLDTWLATHSGPNETPSSETS